MPLERVDRNVCLLPYIMLDDGISAATAVDIPSLDVSKLVHENVKVDCFWGIEVVSGCDGSVPPHRSAVRSPRPRVVDSVRRAM